MNIDEDWNMVNPLFEPNIRLDHRLKSQLNTQSQ